MNRNEPLPGRILKLMKTHVDVDTWGPRQIRDALGSGESATSSAISLLVKRGHVVKADTKARYKLSAETMKEDDTDPRKPRPVVTQKALPGGPCPQSDGVLRAMRAAGGERTARQWASLAIERDSVTVELLAKLVKHKLVAQKGELYKATR